MFCSIQLIMNINSLLVDGALQIPSLISSKPTNQNRHLLASDAFKNNSIGSKHSCISVPTGYLISKFINSVDLSQKICQSKINSRWVAGPIGQMNRRPSV